MFPVFVHNSISALTSNIPPAFSDDHMTMDE